MVALFEEASFKCSFEGTGRLNDRCQTGENLIALKHGKRTEHWPKVLNLTWGI